MAVSGSLAAAGRYNKFIVAVLGAVSVGLTTFAHDAPWVPTVLAILAAAVGWLVPNLPLAPPPQVTMLPGAYTSSSSGSVTVTNVTPGDG